MSNIKYVSPAHEILHKYMLGVRPHDEWEKDLFELTDCDFVLTTFLSSLPFNSLQPVCSIVVDMILSSGKLDSYKLESFKTFCGMKRNNYHGIVSKDEYDSFLSIREQLVINLKETSSSIDPPPYDLMGIIDLNKFIKGEDVREEQESEGVLKIGAVFEVDSLWAEHLKGIIESIAGIIGQQDFNKINRLSTYAKQLKGSELPNKVKRKARKKKELGEGVVTDRKIMSSYLSEDMEEFVIEYDNCVLCNIRISTPSKSSKARFVELKKIAKEMFEDGGGLQDIEIYNDGINIYLNKQ